MCSPEESWTGSYLKRLGSFVQALQTDSNGVSPFKVLRRLAKLYGVEECLDVLAKLVVAVVVVAPNSRLFESTVHPLDPPVRPRMIWLCQSMLNPVRSAEQIEHMGLPPRSRT